MAERFGLEIILMVEKGTTFAFTIPLAFQQAHDQESIAVNTIHAMINDTAERVKKKT